MTLIEALKTGLPLKRPGWSWILPEHRFNFIKDDVLATDWEVQKPEKKKRKVKFYQWRYKPQKSKCRGLYVESTIYYYENYYAEWTRIESSMIEIEVDE